MVITQIRLTSATTDCILVLKTVCLNMIAMCKLIEIF